MENMMEIRFRIDGEVIRTITVEKGEPVIAIEPPEKEGYRFVKWDKLPQRGIADKTATVDAVYEKLSENDNETFSLTMLIDGEVFGSYNFPAGADISTLPTPEKVGHDFSGWSKNYKVMPHSNVTIKGRYIPHIHTLRYIIEDEMEFTKKVNFGVPLRQIGLPVRPNYTFIGWEETPATMPDHDLIYTGRFVLNSHTLRFVLADQLIYEATLDVGTPIKPPEIPAKEGYMFSGWRGLPKKMPDEDYTAEGRYYLRKYKITYMLDGEEYAKERALYGSPIEMIPNPQKEGFVFGGWSDTPAIMPADDIIVTGSFTQA